MAFRIAAMGALRQGFNQAQPQLLEPIMKVEIITPEEFTGEVMGDFAARKGKVEQLLAKGPARIITGNAPLAEMFGYATALRSLTQGRGTFTLQFHYGSVERRRRSKCRGDPLGRLCRVGTARHIFRGDSGRSLDACKSGRLP